MPGMPQLTPEQMQQFQQMMMGGGGGPGGAGPAGPSMGMAPRPSAADARASAEAKKWITLYPIYFDARRSNKDGERRVSWKKASLYPLSSGIVKAVDKLNLRFAHEPNKTHPRDWENPGRVKVKLFDDDGHHVHGKIHNRNQLLDAVAPLLQQYCGGPPPLELPKREKAKKQPKVEAEQLAAKSKKSASTSAPSATATTTTKTTSSANPRKVLSPGSSAHASRVVRLKLLKPHLPPPHVRLPRNSPSLAAGLLNMDLASAMGGGGGPGGLPGGGAGNPMGAIGNMMGNLGFGEDDTENAGDDAATEADKRKQNDPLRGMGRRGRKRVVRVGR